MTRPTIARWTVQTQNTFAPCLATQVATFSCPCIGSCTCREGFQSFDCSTECRAEPDHPITGAIGKHYMVCQLNSQRIVRVKACFVNHGLLTVVQAPSHQTLLSDPQAENEVWLDVYNCQCEVNWYGINCSESVAQKFKTSPFETRL